ncbi:MAG: hypothetical protein PHN38_06350 [Sulfurospirillaceae bacterium]|nr:hypothetical protein [Sulfurospirillaceae bacterium]
MKRKLLAGFIIVALCGVAGFAADGMYKISELFSKKTELKGKKVVVRGTVAKVSAGIMGKDWVRIQDGTQFEGKNEVIFTAPMDKAGVAPGDLVIAKGTLKTDVDLGAGYFYAVLVEESEFTK